MHGLFGNRDRGFEQETSHTPCVGEKTKTKSRKIESKKEKKGLNKILEECYLLIARTFLPNYSNPMFGKSNFNSRQTET